MKHIDYFKWFKLYHTTSVATLKVAMDDLARDTQIELCELIKSTPKEIMDLFLNSDFWLDSYRRLVELDLDKGIGYMEEDSCDEILYISFDDSSQQILKGIIDGFIIFIYGKYPVLSNPNGCGGNTNYNAEFAAKKANKSC